MVEKQASSEIAESRERSKSEILFTRYTGPAIDPVAYDFDDSQREKIFAFTDWCMEAAERDTRERVAQIVDAEAEKAAVWEEKTDSDSAWHVKANLQRVAERIRGKE